MKRRILTLEPDSRLDVLFNDILGMNAARLRGVPVADLKDMARRELMPPSAFRWETRRFDRFGYEGGIMPRGCHLDGTDLAFDVFAVSIGRMGWFPVNTGAPLTAGLRVQEAWLFEADGTVTLDCWL
jgi:hypothetical protein